MDFKPNKCESKIKCWATGIATRYLSGSVVKYCTLPPSGTRSSGHTCKDDSDGNPNSRDVTIKIHEVIRWLCLFICSLVITVLCLVSGHCLCGGVRKDTSSVLHVFKKGHYYPSPHPTRYLGFKAMASCTAGERYSELLEDYQSVKSVSGRMGSEAISAPVLTDKSVIQV